MFLDFLLYYDFNDLKEFIDLLLQMLKSFPFDFETHF